MRAIVEKVNFKRGLVTYEIDGYDYGWLEILKSYLIFYLTIWVLLDMKITFLH